jgi:hypothetical protein
MLFGSVSFRWFFIVHIVKIKTSAKHTIPHNLAAQCETRALRVYFSFDGKDQQGKPQKGTMEFIQEVIKASKDRHIRFAATGDATGASGKGGSFDFYQVGGTTYIYAPEGEGQQKCIGTTSGDNSAGSLAEAFKPSDIIGGLEKARLVGKGETINDVVTDHYSFDGSGCTSNGENATRPFDRAIAASYRAS